LGIKSIVFHEEVRKSEWARFEPGNCRILTTQDIIWEPKYFDILVPRHLEAYIPCNNTDEQNCDSLLNQKTIIWKYLFMVSLKSVFRMLKINKFLWKNFNCSSLQKEYNSPFEIRKVKLAVSTPRTGII